MGIQEYLQLIATVLPANSTFQKITCSSSDPSVAAVANNSRISGLPKGKVQISASKEIYFLGNFAIISFKTLRTKTTSITAKYAENNTYIYRINHNNMAIYIHQLKNWTDFQWNEQAELIIIKNIV